MKIKYRKFATWCLHANNGDKVHEFPYTQRPEAESVAILANAHPACKKMGGPFFIQPGKRLTPESV